MHRHDRDLGMQDQGLKAINDGQEHEGYDNPDPDSVYRKRDEEIAEATDAMIDSLRACDRWAIYKRCGITTQWNFPNLIFADALVVAEKALIEKLKNNLAVRALFR